MPGEHVDAGADQERIQVERVERPAEVDVERVVAGSREHPDPAGERLDTLVEEARLVVRGRPRADVVGQHGQRALMERRPVHRDLVRLTEAIARIVDVVDDRQRPAAAHVAERKPEILREAADLVLEANVETNVVGGAVAVVVDPERVGHARIEGVVVRA